MKEDQHIGVVIAWLDGANPIHQNKHLKFLNKSQEVFLPAPLKGYALIKIPERFNYIV